MLLTRSGDRAAPTKSRSTDGHATHDRRHRDRSHCAARSPACAAHPRTRRLLQLRSLRHRRARPRPRDGRQTARDQPARSFAPEDCCGRVQGRDRSRSPTRVVHRACDSAAHVRHHSPPATPPSKVAQARVVVGVASAARHGGTMGEHRAIPNRHIRRRAPTHRNHRAPPCSRPMRSTRPTRQLLAHSRMKCDLAAACEWRRDSAIGKSGRHCLGRLPARAPSDLFAHSVAPQPHSQLHRHLRPRHQVASLGRR